MDLFTFDPLRTLGLAGVSYIKPDHMYARLNRLQQADGVLFPEYWQVNALVFALKKRIFPSLASYLIGHDKVEMSRCFRALAPDHIPHTEIAANTAENGERVWEMMDLPFVAKIPRASMGEGVFLIEERAQWREYLARTPVIYAQEYLPIDRDLRIVWAGNRVIGGYWRLQADQGFYNNVARGGQIQAGIIPPAAIALVERLATGLGIDHGGFDVAMLGDRPYVFEFNRLFGSRGLRHTKDAIDREIVDYLQAQWGNNTPLEPAPALLPGSA